MLAALGTLALFAGDSAFAQNSGAYGPGGDRPVLRPYTARYYDGRDDRRDFPNNGFFPGDFAANPGYAAIGAAGLFGFTPEHAPPQFVDGAYQTGCARRHRSYNAANGYFVGYDGVRYRCR